MSEPGPRVAAWLGTVCDLLSEHLYDMPHHVIFEQLERTFGVTAVCHNEADSLGRQSILTSPQDVLEPVTDLDEWLRGDSRGQNPLIRWHLATGDPRPWTIGRVPTTLVPLRDRAAFSAVVRRVEIDQQLAINYQLSGRAHRAYVLARHSADFTDDDLVVARHIQPALIALDGHVALMRRLSGLNGLAVSAGLTGRETSVLGLVAAGHTSHAVAHRLGCSPRTVDKHLERIYRKLGVRDRLNAVRVARLQGPSPD